jgi:hypothetical protein
MVPPANEVGVIRIMLEAGNSLPLNLTRQHGLYRRARSFPKCASRFGDLGIHLL